MIERIMKYLDCSRDYFPGGITKDEAELLAEATERNFGYRLPDDVLGVLIEINGFNADGTTFFSFMNEEIRTKFRHMIPRDILYNNLEFRKNDGGPNYLLFGKTELSFFAIEISSGQYVLISNSSDDLFRRFSSFDEAMQCLLEEW